MDRSSVVALFGKLSDCCDALDPLPAEFGWSLRPVPNVGYLRRLDSDCRVVAVLIEVAGLDISWPQALESVRDAAPGARVLACRRFSDDIPWTELAGAGAFHDLHLPFDPLEIRRALGFVWAAQQRAANIAAPIPFPRQRRRAS